MRRPAGTRGRELQGRPGRNYWMGTARGAEATERGAGEVCDPGPSATEVMNERGRDSPPGAGTQQRKPPGEAVAKRRVRAPTRGNRQLEALLDAVNADPQVRAWWYMAQVTSERLGMSDHSWVHVQIVLNIALRLLRLLAKAGRGAGDGRRPRHEAARTPRSSSRPARCSTTSGMSIHRSDHEGYSLFLAEPQAARAARRGLRRAPADGRRVRGAARDHRPPASRRPVHARGAASSGWPTRSTWPRGGRGSPSRPGGSGSTRCRRRRSTRSRSRPAGSPDPARDQAQQLGRDLPGRRPAGDEDPRHAAGAARRGRRRGRGRDREAAADYVPST